ncbi:hypothetical protein GGX14DRAFT_620523 [Mycena pura]|uniref:Uncharacterized protein n=1 Tax=Mycena pura TaxID=153505 RepID=A0AAD6XWY2_9AGAR|nr:hypothetical protein GGX14DRAFT_620523 [Mycena pura]
MHYWDPLFARTSRCALRRVGPQAAITRPLRATSLPRLPPARRYGKSSKRDKDRDKEKYDSEATLSDSRGLGALQRGVRGVPPREEERAATPREDWECPFHVIPFLLVLGSEDSFTGATGAPPRRDARFSRAVPARRATPSHTINPWISPSVYGNHPRHPSTLTSLTSPAIHDEPRIRGNSRVRPLTDLQWLPSRALGSITGAQTAFVRSSSECEGVQERRREHRQVRLTSAAPLSATLQFTPPLSLGLCSPSGAPLDAEITRKLRKGHKTLPGFGWVNHTAPVLGPEEVIEECFPRWVGGHAADLARECAWALVEYKSHSGGPQDPGATLVLFEGLMPLNTASRSQARRRRRRLPSLFTPSPPGGGKTWKQAACSGPRRQ